MALVRGAVGEVAFVVATLAAGHAGAREASVDGDTAPGAPAPPNGAPAPPNGAPAPPNGAPAPPNDERENQTRFRFAVHVAGGPWLVPDRTGGGGGVGIQLGAQINDLVGVYYAGTAAVGVAGSNDAIGAAAGAWLYNSAVVDLTFARIFQLGLGPSLDTLAFADAEVKANPLAPSSTATALAGTYLGIQTRVGLAFGASRPGKSGRFMLGLEVHPTFAVVTPVSVFVTLGGGSF